MPYEQFHTLCTSRLLLSEVTPTPRLNAAKRELRYADPSSWLLSAAASDLLDSNNIALRRDIGIIHVAQNGPQQAMEKIATLAVRRRSSPLKFPAAAPSASAAVACMVCQLRGPSLTLTMSWVHSKQVIASLCNNWLGCRLASFVIVSHEGNDHNTGEPYCEVQLNQPRTAVLQ